MSVNRFGSRVVLVTGVSDQGIGGAVVERMVREGAAVWMAMPHRPEKLLRRLAKTCPSARIGWTSCDVTRQQEIETAENECRKALGQVNILVNNAGVESSKPIDAYTDDEWHQVLDVNLHGAVRMTRACLAGMQSGSVIVNVASALAFGGCANVSIYSASKAGLVGFTQSLAMELAPQRIRVVGVAPGVVATPMTLRHFENITDDGHRQLAASHPLGTGCPQDVAAVVAFLASDEARWITGATIPLGWMPQFPLPVSQDSQRSAA